MPRKYKNMQQNLDYIRKELETFYPAEEIEGFIRVIFHHLKGYSLTDLVLRRDERLSEEDEKSIRNVVEQLKRNIPIQYIIGEAEFCDLKFRVSPDVLIPRPETEELVLWIAEDYQGATNLQAFDACAGSGCIAVSLAKMLHQAEVSACDISEKALQMAEVNAELNQVNVKFERLDMLHWQGFEGEQQFDCIVSNPPYVLDSEKAQMNNNVLEHEPHLALFVADDEALIFYESIASFAKVHLKAGGHLYFEINEAFGEEMKQMLQGMGFVHVELRQDVFGKNRMMRAEIHN